MEASLSMTDRATNIIQNVDSILCIFFFLPLKQVRYTALLISSEHYIPFF